MTDTPRLSVVIPAFREEDRLGPTLDAVRTWLETRPDDFEILVVDDGSDDGTADVARSRDAHTLRLPENRGKGAAARAGVLASRGELVLLTDADLSTPIDDLPRLEARLADAELVLGSRSVPESELIRRQPLYRELMGKTFNRIIRLAGVRGLADTQCGFKLLVGDVAREIFSRVVTPGFAFDVEMVWLARRAGYRVVEVGVRWENSPTSRVRPVVDSLSMLLEIVRFRWAHRGAAPGSGPLSPGG